MVTGTYGIILKPVKLSGAPLWIVLLEGDV